MATGSSSLSESFSSSEQTTSTSTYSVPIINCDSCGSSDLLRDACASEMILVCKNCGSVVESGSLEQEYGPISNKTTALVTGQGGHYIGTNTSPETVRKCQIVLQIDRICDNLRIMDHARKVCIEKVNEVMKETKRTSNVKVAAGLVYMMATDQSLSSLRNIASIVQLNERAFRMFIIKLKSLPLFRDFVLPPRLPTVQEMIIDYFEKLNTPIEVNEKKESMTMMCNIYELLLQTELKDDLEQSLRSRQVVLLEPIIFMAVEYIHKTKTQSGLYEVVVKKAKPQSRSFMKRSTLIRKNLFALAQKIPALDVAISERKLTQVTVAKYLPTIIQSKGLLSADKIVTEHQKEMEELNEGVFSNEPNPYLCTPMEFNWEDDEVGDFNDIDDDDVEQYLATDEEIAARKPSFEEFFKNL